MKKNTAPEGSSVLDHIATLKRCACAVGEVHRHVVDDYGAEIVILGGEPATYVDDFGLAF